MLDFCSRCLDPAARGGLWILLLFVFILATHQVKADEENGDQVCKIEEIGGKHILVSPIDRLKNCYAVVDERCCYHKEGREKDCNKYTNQNGMKCLMKESEFVVTVDSRGTGTCNLTTESSSGFPGGNYKALTADGFLIQECVVKEKQQKGSGTEGGKTGAIVGGVAALILITAAVVAAIYIRKRCMAQKEGGFEEVPLEEIKSTIVGT